MDEKSAQIFQFIWFDLDKHSTMKWHHKTADGYRNLLHQINFCGATDSISQQCENKLKEKYLEHYRALVDDQQGVNNYAEMVLTLVAHKKNESSNWKSAFHDLSDDQLYDLIPESCRKTEASSSDDQHFLCQFSKVSKMMNQDEQTESPDNTSLVGKYEPSVPRSFNDSTCNKNSVSAVLVSSSNVAKEKVPAEYNGNAYVQNSGFPPQSSATSLWQNCGPLKTKNANLVIPALAGPNKSCNGGSKLYRDSKNQLNDRACPTKVTVESHLFTEAETRINKRKHIADEFSVPTKSEPPPFKTAKEQLDIEYQKKYGTNPQNLASHMVYGSNRKCLGTRRGPSSKFVPPVINKSASDGNGQNVYDGTDAISQEDGGILQDDRLKNVDPKMVKLMLNEIMDHGPPVSWDDIAGLEFAKNTIKEIVVWPMLRPDIFTGLRGPPKGILLFGPPGTGKTLIGKCIASQSKSTFFCISASSLTSKWVGEGEKLVRALFAVAKCYQPAVIFIDEIDSLLTQRSDSEHESSRRMKTEFLVQLDGATTTGDERLLIVGATNRPQELDEAARRRLVKRLYIPLPEPHARRQIVQTLLCDHSHSLTNEDLDLICEKTAGYSGADMANLCKEAALGPIRSISFENIEFITADQVRPINVKDFIDALKQVRASVSDRDLELYAEWNQKFGSGCPA